MYNGLVDRLEKELENLAPKNGMVKVIAPVDRYNSVWMGGSVLSGLKTFESSYCTKEEYNEYGPEICHRKFV